MYVKSNQGKFKDYKKMKLAHIVKINCDFL